MNFQLQIISYFIALSDSETKNSKLVIVIMSCYGHEKSQTTF